MRLCCSRCAQTSANWSRLNQMTPNSKGYRHALIFRVCFAGIGLFTATRYNYTFDAAAHHQGIFQLCPDDRFMGRSTCLWAASSSKFTSSSRPRQPGKSLSSRDPTFPDYDFHGSFLGKRFLSQLLALLSPAGFLFFLQAASQLLSQFH